MSRKKTHRPTRLVTCVLSVLVLAILSISSTNQTDATSSGLSVNSDPAETYTILSSIIESGSRAARGSNGSYGAKMRGELDLAPPEDIHKSDITSIADEADIGVDINTSAEATPQVSVSIGELNVAATDTPPVFMTEVPLLDVEMSAELQYRIFTEVCNEDSMQFCLMMAIAEQESRFNPAMIGDGGNSYGIVQINRRWHLDRIERLGVTDLFDPVQCMSVGLDYIEELMDNLNISTPTHRLLMAYNMGPSGARNAYNNGVYSSAYSREVMERYEQFMTELAQ